MCVCVRACACVRVRACVRACVPVLSWHCRHELSRDNKLLQQELARVQQEFVRVQQQARQHAHQRELTRHSNGGGGKQQQQQKQEEEERRHTHGVLKQLVVASRAESQPQASSSRGEGVTRSSTS